MQNLEVDTVDNATALSDQPASQCASISLQSIIVWSLTAATSLFAHLTCMHLQAVPWSYLRLAGHKQQQPPSEHEGERH